MLLFFLFGGHMEGRRLKVGRGGGAACQGVTEESLWELLPRLQELEVLHCSCLVCVCVSVVWADE